jgi:DNA mismatch repair ATPase MutS
VGRRGASAGIARGPQSRVCDSLPGGGQRSAVGDAELARSILPARVVEAVEQPARDLALLAQVLARLERERFTSARLVELGKALDAEGGPPSARIAKLNRLIEMLDSRDNPAMKILGPLMLWTEQLAFAIEAWRRESGPALRRWLAAVGEIEALCALAAYAWEHPADVLPEFASEKACFDGEDLAHPLLDASTVVRNSVCLGGDLRLLIVSGSNMSGKSTLLRTVGVNAVLAQAGAPVRARRLRLSPLSLGASIRISDSLQGGTSRFYAEIKRLHQVMELTGGPLTVLFLLDELLHGTNSHDRRIGAEAIVRGLVERGGMGLITTHDLALAHIAETLGSRAANVHFEDQFENGLMHFDYRLHPGVVEKSNALELMRSVGLEV